MAAQQHLRRVVILASALGAAAPAAAIEEPSDEPPRFTSPRASLLGDVFHLTLAGYFRVRGDLWNDLDLSRGPTPSTGQPVFPVPAAGGSDHTLVAGDMRLRLEPTLTVSQAVRIHLRVDVLDDVGFGSTPDVLPSGSGFSGGAEVAVPPEAGINALHDAVQVKQVWGEIVLPIGVLAAGRMGAIVNWGTGFVINNGNCIGCDHGDTGDRITFATPILGHTVAVAYELSASGPYANLDGQNVDLDARAHVNTWALMVARYDSPTTQHRLVRAGRTLVQYGLLASYRTQDLDAPAWTQPGGLTRSYQSSSFVHRGLSSFAGDLWLLVHRGGFRAELEAAVLVGQVDNATNDPGVTLTAPVTLRQWGGVASLAYGFARLPLRARCEIGVASGDDAPGFGVRLPPGQLATQKGDLDGPQARVPTDTTINNFRFSPDYHVDLILWRRIIGQISDAIYVRPSILLGPFGSFKSNITFELAAIDSHAMFATTPPGQDTNLGVELDLHARWHIEPKFDVDVGYGAFFPGAGFRNLALDLEPKPAQTLEIILAYHL